MSDLPHIPGYRISETVSQAATTFLCRGHREEDGGGVILKVLQQQRPDLGDIARFEHEYEITRDLQVEGILRARTLERRENQTVLAFDDFRGVPLDRTLREHPIELEPFLRLAAALATTVGDLHKAGIIHKDIKPGNILVDVEAIEVRLTAFSIASRLSHENQTFSHPHLLEGTLAYMSPEQTGRLNRSIDYRTDFYSLGVTFYEMLTGSLPFSQADPLELVHAHVAREPLPPSALNSAVPDVVADIVLRMMAKTADARYKSAHGLKADLDKCLRQLTQNGEIERFNTGANDFTDRLCIEEDLYGREKELAELQTVFSRVCHGPAELVLVTGYSGIGKSSLINEIRRPIVEQNGIFIAGEFDQLQFGTPYSAVSQAFRTLTRQLLGESDDVIESWKSRILEALGSNAQIIVDLIPEMELVIGEQPDVVALAPEEAQNRLNLVWQRFILAFAAGDRPLVLFLDDLQWVDSATLSLIRIFLEDASNHHVMIVGGFRANEVGPSHPLRLTIQQLEAKQRPVLEMALSGLSPDDLIRWISDSLRCGRQQIQELAAVIFNKTEGNPFFVVQFLETIYRGKLLRFAASRGMWEWDLRAIGRKDITDNVVDLLAHRIERLGSSEQELLKFASCLGTTFDIGTLATISEKHPRQITDDLWAAILEGLVQPMSDFNFRLQGLEAEEADISSDEAVKECKFLHDRVRQAAYSLIAEHQREEHHLKIGRLLLARSQDDESDLEDRLFDIVYHLNLGSAGIESAEESTRLAELNLAAATKAQGSAAYREALRLFSAGARQLGGEPGPQGELRFDLEAGLAESHYLCGEFVEAEEQCDKLLQRAGSSEQRQRVYNLLITIFTSQGKYAEALATGGESAADLGFTLPKAPNQSHIIREFAKAKWNLRFRDPDELLQLPEMKDPTQLASMELLMNLIAPAMLSNEIFGIVISLKMFNSSLRNGISKASPFGYMMFGVVNVGLGRYDDAMRFGKLALRLNEKVGNREIQHVISFLFSTAINHWKEHAETNVTRLSEAYGASLDAGDLVYADYSLVTVMLNKWFKGDPIEDTLSACDSYIDFFRRVKGGDLHSTIQGQIALIARQQLLCLTGKTRAPGDLTDEEFDEGECRARVQNSYARFGYYTIKLSTACVFRQFGQVEAISNEAAEVMSAVKPTGDVRIPEFYFCQSLGLLGRLASDTTSSDRKRLHSTVRSNAKALGKWASHCPANFEHRHLLVEAELARIGGDDLEATTLYDRAIAAANEHGFAQVEALAHEAAGRFHMAAGRQQMAIAHLQNSRYAYRRWGATAKIRQLEDEFPQLHSERQNAESSAATTATTATTATISGSSQLDVSAITKAIQAISSEIVLEKLLQRLMEIVIEAAGARKGYLLLAKDGRWVIEAEGAADEEEIKVMQTVPVTTSVDGYPILPVSVINYVSRTRETVVLDDATEESIHSSDPYIAASRSKSILCAPMLNQGELKGILYLENDLTTNAFTPDRVHVLNLMTAQAAISIENAALYRQVEGAKVDLEDVNRSLEQRVADRTEELRRINEELESELQTAHDMQMDLMPVEMPSIDGFDIAGRCLPATHVGGDFYQFFHRPDGLAIAVADVAGHGMRAAIPVVMFSGLLTRQIRESASMQQLMTDVNAPLVDLLDRRTFICFAAGLLDPHMRTFSLSAAGYPFPFHYQAATGDVSEVELPATPLGIRVDTVFGLTEVVLQPGDRLVLCSDGVMEAGEEGEEFGYDRTIEAIRQGCEDGLGAEALIDAVLSEITKFTEDLRPTDDQTIVVVRSVD